MLYPSVLPLMSMFDAFFHDSANVRRRLKVFYIVFGTYVALLCFRLDTHPKSLVYLFGNSSLNGYSHSSPVSRFSALLSRTTRRSPECLVEATVMRGLVFSLSASTGRLVFAQDSDDGAVS